MFWLIVAIVVASEAFAINYLKKYSLNNSKNNLFISLIFYLIYALSFAELFKTKKIATSAAITGMLALVSITLMGFVLYNEKLNKKEMFGVLLALISICLLL